MDKELQNIGKFTLPTKHWKGLAVDPVKNMKALIQDCAVYELMLEVENKKYAKGLLKLEAARPKKKKK